nr:HD domain-containing phosphohydrolase [Halanaerobium saccharolyticum]
MKLKEEVKIVMIYLLIGFGWIYFSDKILLLFIGDSVQLNQLQTYKGIFYVIVTAIIFYFLFKKYLNDLRKQHQKLEAKNKKLIESNKKIDTINQELDASLKSLEKLNKRFVKMISFVYSLNEKSNLNEEEFLSDLLYNIIEIIPEADYGKIYLIENGQCNFIEAVGHDIDALKQINIFEKSLLDFDSEGVNFSKNYSVNIDDLTSAKKKDFKKALKNIKESMYIDIKVKNRVVGRISLDIAENSEQNFNQGTTHILESFSTLASSFFAYKRFDRLQGKFTKELISSIIKILEIYDEYTKGHSENVANLSMLIAEEMGLSEETVLDTYWAGMVHDIGKLLVPVQILNKTERLEEFEYDIIKKHPVWSSRALADSETLKHISKYVLYHHERWDGYGYPEGLAAEDIPLVSQIIAVADAWDAMTSNRSYRDSLSKEAAIKEIKNNKGSQFSPRAAAAFLRLIDKKELEAVKNKYENYKGMI